MGRVSTRGQWLIVAAGVLLSPAFVLLTAYVIGWSLLRKFSATVTQPVASLETHPIGLRRSASRRSPGGVAP